MTLSSTDYALLAQDSYHDPVLDKRIELGGVAYKAIDNANNPHTGFQATAYLRLDTNEVIIAYRGTEFDREPVHDGGVDAGMVLTGINAQAPDAVAFTQRVIDKAKQEAELNDRSPNITVTGHSLGGTLAEISAAKFGLKGETFNAYGAAGLLHGVPEGGHQVIDHVRAGDVVSAASPHFGEVRIYAAQQDIDTLSKAGYRDDSGVLSLRNPVKAIDFGAHAIDNFVPESKLLGQSIINPESQARYLAHEGMVDRYRNDVQDIRKGLSAGWEIPKAIGETAYGVGHAAVEKLEEGVHAVGHAAQHVAQEVGQTIDHVRKEVVEDAQAVGNAALHVAHEIGDTISHVGKDISEGLHSAGHAISEKASQAWDTLSHPGSWFDDKPATPAPVRLDQTGHPDHPLYQQARGAVHELDAAHQRTPDQRSDNLAASLTVAARRDGLTRIDHAELSDDAARTYAVQGELNSPLKRIVDVPTQEAMATSIERSSVNWEQLAAQKQLAQAQQQELQQQSVQKAGPSPGM
ncbi:lipase (class 3) [Luteibacter rhizovicinus]|uniref:Lipase (Class 3) n=1 Tax=Luteibacter rhizovicinus TaxID=242606 RepID=A0A4R3Z082_9GAMM|nr:XVIPCD domain-containing protein [Luteibacter rhizovicinus]TCV97214.1 lipase (class 3) [Luteibacter rhizovicinus]